MGLPCSAARADLPAAALLPNPPTDAQTAGDPRAYGTQPFEAPALPAPAPAPARRPSRSGSAASDLGSEDSFGTQDSAYDLGEPRPGQPR